MKPDLFLDQECLPTTVVLSKLARFVCASGDIERLLRWHGISRMLGALPPELLGEAATIVHGYAVRAALRSELQISVLREALAVLNRAGIPVLVIKGIAFESIYLPVGLHRDAQDIDLVVPPGSLSQALQALRHERSGFRVSSAQDGGIVIDGVSIDLHAGLPWYGASDRDSWAGLWARRVGWSLEGAAFFTLGPVDTFELLIRHGAKHQWAKLRWIMDVVWLCEGASQAHLSDLIAESDRRGYGRSARVGLLLARFFMTDELSAWTLSRCGGSTLTRVLVKSYLFDVARPREGLIERVRNIVRTILLGSSVGEGCSYIVRRLRSIVERRRYRQYSW